MTEEASGTRGLLLAALALSLALAGCVGMTGDDDQDLDMQDVQDGKTLDKGQEDETMTAEESTTEDEGADANLPPFYAKRTTVVKGKLLLDELPVRLITMNGDIEVTTGQEDRWRLIATMTGRGSSPQEAQEQRDRINFQWAIGETGDHRIVGVVQVEEDDSDPSPVSLGSWADANLSLELPPSLMANLHASTSNGDITVEDLTVARAKLDTSNGDIDLSELAGHRIDADTSNGDIAGSIADTRSVDLDTSNGDIDVTIRPGGSGSIEADTSNGEIDLRVPEDQTHGYEAVADTSNGQVTIELEDGSTSKNEDGDRAEFETNGYDRRTVKTTVRLDSSNGDIVLGPTGHGDDLDPAGDHVPVLVG